MNDARFRDPADILFQLLTGVLQTNLKMHHDTCRTVSITLAQRQSKPVRCLVRQTPVLLRAWGYMYSPFEAAFTATKKVRDDVAVKAASI